MCCFPSATHGASHRVSDEWRSVNKCMDTSVNEWRSSPYLMLYRLRPCLTDNWFSIRLRDSSIQAEKGAQNLVPEHYWPESQPKWQLDLRAEAQIPGVYLSVSAAIFIDLLSHSRYLIKDTASGLKQGWRSLKGLTGLLKRKYGSLNTYTLPKMDYK